MSFPARISVIDTFSHEKFNISTEEELKTLMNSEADLFLVRERRIEVRDLIPRILEFIVDQSEPDNYTEPDVREWKVNEPAPTTFRVHRS